MSLANVVVPAQVSRPIPGDLERARDQLPVPASIVAQLWFVVKPLAEPDECLLKYVLRIVMIVRYCPDRPPQYFAMLLK
jgi:hypothetical protein